MLATVLDLPIVECVWGIDGVEDIGAQGNAKRWKFGNFSVKVPLVHQAGSAAPAGLIDDTAVKIDFSNLMVLTNRIWEKGVDQEIWLPNEFLGLDGDPVA